MNKISFTDSLSMPRSVRRFVVFFLTRFSSFLVRNSNVYVCWDWNKWLEDDVETKRRAVYYLGGPGQDVELLWGGRFGVNRWTIFGDEISASETAGWFAFSWAALRGRVLFAKASPGSVWSQRIFGEKFFVVDWKTTGYPNSTWRWLAASSQFDYSRIKEKWKSFPHPDSDRVVVMGTGPSAPLIFDEKYRDLPVIACNTSLKSERLRKHKIAAFCIADALYFLAPTPYGARFREMLSIALESQRFPIIINAEHYHFFLRRFSFVPDDLLFPVYVNGNCSLDLDMRRKPFVPGACSVFPMFMLPVASSFYKNILLIGFDGKNPSMKNYYWKHSGEFQYEEELPSVKEHDEGFFGGRNPDFYDKYNLQYGREIEDILKMAKGRGCKLSMEHSSFVPVLQRLHGSELQLRPKISVVTPSFNQARYLEATVRSVIEQDYPNVEFIVMDGGSSDGSVEILEKYSPRISYWQSQKDKGQSDAIAAGFERATGDILCWLNSDDVFLPGTLSAVASFFEAHPDEEVLTGGALIIDERGNYLKGRFCNVSLGQEATLRQFLFYGMDGVMQLSVFWRRRAYDAAGGLDRSLHHIMDKDLFVRMAQQRQFAALPRLLGAFRLHSESKTTNEQAIHVREQIIFERKYGIENSSKLKRKSLYAAFRLKSLFRRFVIVLRIRTGKIKIPEQVRP